MRRLYVFGCSTHVFRLHKIFEYVSRLSWLLLRILYECLLSSGLSSYRLCNLIGLSWLGLDFCQDWRREYLKIAIWRLTCQCFDGFLNLGFEILMGFIPWNHRCCDCFELSPPFPLLLLILMFQILMISWHNSIEYGVCSRLDQRQW